MEYRTLGNSDLFLSVLGLGCWPFGGGEYWGDQDQADVDAVVNLALDLGVTYFDTAEAYNNGTSEQSLGIALHRRRGEAIVGSKVSPSNCQPETLREHCDASLARLQSDVIDLYMVHWPFNPLAVKHFTSDETLIASPPSAEDAFRTLGDLKDEGKIRAIGVSNFGVTQLEEALATGVTIVANQLAYNLVSRAIEVEILPFCRQNGISIIGDMGLQQGILTGKYERPEDVPPMRARSRHFRDSRGQGLSRHGDDGAEEELFNSLAEIRRISTEIGYPMGQVALAWAAANSDVTCTLVGSRDAGQFEENLKSLEVPLTPSLIAELNNATIQLLEKMGPNPDYYESNKHGRIW